jgi:hypothetical protein
MYAFGILDGESKADGESKRVWFSRDPRPRGEACWPRWSS